MSRYIDIEPIIEWCDDPDVVEPYGIRGSALYRKIRYAPTIEVPTWIPCSERLPNESDYYLVTLRDAFNEIEICVVWFAHEDDYDCDSEWREITDSDTVLAWMPLPKPYINSSEKPNNSNEKSSE